MEDQKSSFRWFVLILAVANLFFGIIAKESIPPLFSEIQMQIPLTKTQMGTTMGVVSLAALFFAVFGGALSDRFGSRMVFGGSILIIL
jgi:MFS family permease